MTKGELRAQEYRARARDAWALVEAATLEHVREQRRRAATAWTEMAEAEEARAQNLRLPPPRRSK
jgi:hypothetical protein